MKDGKPVIFLTILDAARAHHQDFDDCNNDDGTDKGK